MKIVYTIYSIDNEAGKMLATLTDMNQANMMEPYFRNLYHNDRFKVTVKYGRQKAEHFCGWFR